MALPIREVRHVFPNRSTEEVFEGLADVITIYDKKPAKCIRNPENEDPQYCIISGRYRYSNGDEEVVIAIGLWDDERKCFSTLVRTKDGVSLPSPFIVRPDKELDEEQGKLSVCKKIDIIFRELATEAQDASFEHVLKTYNRVAKENQ